MHPYASGVDVEGERDLVAASDRDHMRLDPDPVELPDGTWVEFNFGSYPPVHLPAAEAAGFRADSNLLS